MRFYSTISLSFDGILSSDGTLACIILQMITTQRSSLNHVAKAVLKYRVMHIDTPGGLTPFYKKRNSTILLFSDQFCNTPF